MARILSFTILIEKEDDMYVSLCPELDIASQGESVEQAKSNLKEAVELFFETASESEITPRINKDIFISRLEVAPRLNIVGSQIVTAP